LRRYFDVLTGSIMSFQGGQFVTKEVMNIVSEHFSNVPKPLTVREQESARASFFRFVIGFESKKIRNGLPKSSRHSLELLK
jgi:hypothetical protein